MSGLRRLAIWVPDWPVAALALDCPPGTPVVLAAQGRIQVSTPAARKSGVTRGMRLRTAEQLCPELLALPLDPNREGRAFEPVIAAVEKLLAFVEPLRPGLLLAPAAGGAKWFGTEDTLCAGVVEEITRQTGVECQVGVGTGLLCAVLAARSGEVVSAGQEQAFLAQFQLVEATRVWGQHQPEQARELLEALRRLGINTLGDLAALPVRDVLGRFGKLGTQLHTLAGGGDIAPAVIRRVAPDLVVQTELDPPLDRIDRAAFAGRALAVQLLSLLAAQGYSCARLQITARTAAGEELSRTWLLAGAAGEQEITERVRWQLQGWLAGGSGATPQAPLTALELQAREVYLAGRHQSRLWGGDSGEDLRAQRAALRLQSLLGPDKVTVPVIQGGFDPRTRVYLATWGDSKAELPPVDAPWTGALIGPAPAVVPAQQIEVELLAVTGEPIKVDGRGQLTSPPHSLRSVTLSAAEEWLPVTEAITDWQGPWTVLGKWWDDKEQARGRRAYLRVETSSTKAWLLRCQAERWYLDGCYPASPQLPAL